ncbi:MAG: LicD family protein [Sphaerochaetaceae bacterium]|nr:LicD family protein [Sphaerochaetaceae bacterium]
MIIVTTKQIQKIESDMLRSVAAILDAHAIPWFVLYGTALGTVRHGGSIPWDTDIDIGIPYYYLKSASEVLRKELPNRYSLLSYQTDDSYVLLFPRVAVSGYFYSHLHIDIFPIIGAAEYAIHNEKRVKQLNLLMHQFGIKKHITVYARTPLRKMIKEILQEVHRLLLFRSAKRIIRQYEQICEKYPYDEALNVHVVCPCYGSKNIFPRSWLGTGTRKNFDNQTVVIPKEYELYLTHYYNNFRKFPSKQEQEKGLHKTLRMPESIWNTLKASK